MILFHSFLVENSMFCGYCGKQNSDEYRFCSKCGELIELANETSTYSEDADLADDNNSLLDGEYEEDTDLLEEANDSDSESESDDDYEDDEGSTESPPPQQQKTLRSNSTSSSQPARSTETADVTGMVILVGVVVVGIAIILLSQCNGEKRAATLLSNKQAVESFKQSNKKSSRASQSRKNKNLNSDKLSQKSKLSEPTLIEDISIAESLKTGEKQKCGSHVLQLKKKMDEDGLNSQHIEIMNDRGTFYDSIEGYRISQVACMDLTGDGKINLFLQYWGGGNSPSSYDSYAYILEDPVRLILNLNFHSLDEFIDLNNDGIQEIQSYYSFRYIGGLCGSCSPPMIPQYLCYQNGRYKDCSNQFPDHYAWLATYAKEIILDELKKIQNIDSISDDSELDKLKAHSVLVLVSAILTGKEDQESEYLRKTLPSSVFNWLNKRESRDYIDGQLNFK
jgi:hypothetical protein